MRELELKNVIKIDVENRSVNEITQDLITLLNLKEKKDKA
jgi:hypothetical protein